jgi:hypothetical protein
VGGQERREGASASLVNAKGISWTHTHGPNDRASGAEKEEGAGGAFCCSTVQLWLPIHRGGCTIGKGLLVGGHLHSVRASVSLYV